ncbi:hypothetical protein GE21DRAFT_1270289 [Neurospora crassa]|nr:hypothetical protein GE21DRAFT_1270289 [Neurospora crassa]
MDGNSPQAAALRIGRLSIRTRNHTLAGCNGVQFGRDETVCTYVCHVMIRLYGTVTATVMSFLQDKATVSQFELQRERDTFDYLYLEIVEHESGIAGVHKEDREQESPPRLREATTTTTTTKMIAETVSTKRNFPFSSTYPFVGVCLASPRLASRLASRLLLRDGMCNVNAMSVHMHEREWGKMLTADMPSRFEPNYRAEKAGGWEAIQTKLELQRRVGVGRARARVEC